MVRQAAPATGPPSSSAWPLVPCLALLSSLYLTLSMCLLMPGEEYPESFFGPAGSSRYWAPELFDGEPSSPSSDVWACGVLLYRLLTAGSFPFTVSFRKGHLLGV